MLQDMLVLLGLGLFIKVFFDSAKHLRDYKNAENKKKFLLSTCIHVGLALLFIVIARIYIAT